MPARRTASTRPRAGRARAREAGADVLFVEALQGEEEIEVVAREFAGVPLLFNWAEGGKTPPLTYDASPNSVSPMIIMPIGTLLAATRAMQQFLASLKATALRPTSSTS